MIKSASSRRARACRAWPRLGLLLLASWSVARAQSTCSADFSAIGQGTWVIEIRQEPEGRFDAVVNGITTHARGSVVDEVVRANLNLGAASHSEEFAQYNSAERSLVHLNSVLSLRGSAGLIDVPFSLAAVRRMKTFDLVGKTDKFGGLVLLEAYDQDGALLGRVVRRVFVAPCR